MSAIVDVRRFVHALESLARRRFPSRSRAPRGESGRFEMGGNLPQPLGPLRVAESRVVVEKSWIGIEKRQCWSFGCGR